MIRRGTRESSEAEALQRFLVAVEQSSQAPSDVETYGESIAAVNRVRVVESGEALIDLRRGRPELLFARSHPWAPHQRGFLVRESVADMLGRAQTLLPAGYRLQILEGYRPLQVQRRLFQALYEQLRRRYTQWQEHEVREAANVLIADPEIEAPPPHATGGAVDVTLADAAGRPLDMTGPIGWTEAAAPSACESLSGEARANRQILFEALSAAGLTNYAGEWWHWSFGESGWAARTGREVAFYGAVEAPIPARRVISGGHVLGSGFGLDRVSAPAMA